MSPLRFSPARLWLCWSCSCESPGVIQNVTDDEEEPARDAQEDCQHLACRVVFRVLRVLPEEPVGRQQHQTDRRDMLLEIEEALGLPVAGLLNGNADIGAILDVDVRSQDEG